MAKAVSKIQVLDAAAEAETSIAQAKSLLFAVCRWNSFFCNKKKDRHTLVGGVSWN